jgi:hypothetical protein
MRLITVLLGFLAAGLLVLGSLLPEFTSGGAGVAQVDPSRIGWVPALVGMLVQVGLVLSGALMVALRESRLLAGGLLLGAGILGLSLRVVRLFQLAEAPGFNAAVGSGVDLLAETLTTGTGILALLGAREDAFEEEVDDHLEEGYEPDDGEETPATSAPPPGETA